MFRNLNNLVFRLKLGAVQFHYMPSKFLAMFFYEECNIMLYLMLLISHFAVYFLFASLVVNQRRAISCFTSKIQVWPNLPVKSPAPKPPLTGLANPNESFSLSPPPSSPRSRVPSLCGEWFLLTLVSSY